MRSAKVLAVGVALVLYLAGCSSDNSRIAHVEGQTAFATSTATDWVTYGDAFIEITVEQESELPSPDLAERGEGQLARRITLRVDEVSWQGRERRPATLPDRFTIAHGGWIIRQDVKPQRWLTEGAVWPEVGDRLVALVTWANLSLVVDPDTRKINGDRRSPNPEWTVLELLPLKDQRIPVSLDVTDSAVKRLIAGKRPAEVGDLLQATAIDPGARKYMDLDPFVRSQMVSLDRG